MRMRIPCPPGKRYPIFRSNPLSLLIIFPPLFTLCQERIADSMRAVKRKHGKIYFLSESHALHEIFDDKLIISAGWDLLFEETP